MKFEIGQRVRCIKGNGYATKGAIGTIYKISSDGYTINWENFNDVNARRSVLSEPGITRSWVHEHDLETCYVLTPDKFFSAVMTGKN